VILPQLESVYEYDSVKYVPDYHDPLSQMLGIGIAAEHRWVNGVVPYEVSDGLKLKTEVAAAIKTFNETFDGHLKFVPRDPNSGAAYVEIVRPDVNECFAHAGTPKPGGKHQINLGDNCGAQSVILHEMLHIAGLRHTQARHDRDKYINVHEENVEEKFRGNYHKAPASWSDFFAYDYVRDDKGNCKGKTMTRKDGQAFPAISATPTETDVATIKQMYTPWLWYVIQIERKKLFGGVESWFQKAHRDPAEKVCKDQGYRLPHAKEIEAKKVGLRDFLVGNTGKPTCVHLLEREADNTPRFYNFLVGKDEPLSGVWMGNAECVVVCWRP
jgi:Astacin (Peptidase family M12A)